MIEMAVAAGEPNMRRVQLTRADERLEGLAQVVCDDRQPIVLEREGRPLAVLITPHQFEAYQGFVTQRFMDAVQAIHERNATADPDELTREVTEAVEEVRQAAYERSLRDQSGR
jgi:hypothetical protein